MLNSRPSCSDLTDSLLAPKKENERPPQESARPPDSRLDMATPQVITLPQDAIPPINRYSVDGSRCGHLVTGTVWDSQGGASHLDNRLNLVQGYAL